MNFIDILRSRAYDGLSIENFQVDLQGWMNETGMIQAIDAISSWFNTNGISVIRAMEVGTWKGGSVHFVIKGLKEKNIGIESFIAIDTWLGAPEFWTWGLNDPERGLGLTCVNGYPTVYYTFIKNMKSLGHDSIVAPLPISSAQAVDVLAHYNIKADLIYIDAAHEYDAVLQDLHKYMTLRSDKGILWGDDYVCWPGVRKAVDEFAELHKSQFKLYAVENTWLLIPL